MSPGDIVTVGGDDTAWVVHALALDAKGRARWQVVTKITDITALLAGLKE